MHVTADSVWCEKQGCMRRACRVNFDFEQHAIIIAGCLFAEGEKNPKNANACFDSQFRGRDRKKCSLLSALCGPRQFRALFKKIKRVSEGNAVGLKRSDAKCLLRFDESTVWT